MTKKLQSISEQINKLVIGKEVIIISESIFGFPVIVKGIVVDSCVKKVSGKSHLIINREINGKLSETTITSSEELYLYDGSVTLDDTANKAIKDWREFSSNNTDGYFKFDKNVIKDTVANTNAKPMVSYVGK